MTGPVTTGDHVSHAGPDAIKVDWKRDRLDNAVPVSQATLEGAASPARPLCSSHASGSTLRVCADPVAMASGPSATRRCTL